MEDQGATLNNFGGFKIKIGHWAIDIWALSQTWAARAGHCRVAQLQDVINTTFFDWDSIIYCVDKGKILCHSNYFERLASRVLDINLEPNPNVVGSVVRSLRFVTRRHAQIGPQLAIYLATKLQIVSDEDIMSAEWKAYRTRHMISDFLRGARQKICSHVDNRSRAPLDLAPQMRGLWSQI